MSTQKSKSPAKKSTKQLQSLNTSELDDARNLVHEAGKANLAVVDAGAAVQAARVTLMEAEIAYANAWTQNREIHAKLAPLIKRLPQA